MLCRMCCEECLDFEDLYDEDGQQNYIFNICQKFFSQEMQKLDTMLDRCSKIICIVCWKTIDEFNGFYEKIVAQQSEYCDLIAARKSLKIPEDIDAFDGMESEIILKNEFLRESSFERSKESDLENTSHVTDSFMIETKAPITSTVYGLDLSDLKDSVEIKVEQEEFMDISENYLSEDDDASQSLSYSFQDEAESDDESKEMEKETSLLKPNELPEKRIEEIKNQILNKKWRIMLSCDLCEYSTLKYAHYIMHYKKTHPNNLNSQKFQRPYECEVCQRCFSRITKLRDHILTHTDYRKFKCPKCDRRFTCTDYLYKHIKYKHRETNERWTCDHCGAKISSRDHLKAHKESKRCKMQHLKLDNKAKDMLRKHLDERKDKTTKIINDIKNGLWKPTLRCDLCEFSSQVDKKFLTHYKRHHPNNVESPELQRLFQCEICYQRLWSRKSLVRHIFSHDNSTKDNDNPHKGKRFYCETIPVDKQMHSKRRWSCDLCGVNLGSKVSLDYHKSKKVCVNRADRKLRHLKKKLKNEKGCIENSEEFSIIISDECSASESIDTKPNDKYGAHLSTEQCLQQYKDTLESDEFQE